MAEQPKVLGPEGISTVRSMSFDEDGQEVLVPTVDRKRGVLLSDELAKLMYALTGEHLGKFDTPDDADQYAEQLHNEYEAGKYEPVTPKLFINGTQIQPAVSHKK